ncbi:CBN-DDL-3 protein, partial [Aphelenchoides avenae]
FKLARKYLSYGIDRIIHINDCAPLVVGYYCNYAEVLFHTDAHDEALQYARKAVELAQSSSPKVRNHAERFCRMLEKDIRREGKSEILKKEKGWKGIIPGLA